MSRTDAVPRSDLRERAAQAMAAGDLAAARRALTAAVAQTPGDAELYTRLGQVEVALGQYQTADHYLEQALQHAPSAERLFVRAQCRDGLGDSDGAFALYRHAANISDPDGIATAAAAAHYALRGEMDTAIRLFAIYFSRYPKATACAPLHTTAPAEIDPPGFYDRHPPLRPYRQSINTAFARGAFRETVQGAQIWVRDPLFPAPDSELDAVSARLIANHLTLRRDAWESGALPPPRLQRVFDGPTRLPRNLPATLICQQHIFGRAGFLPNELPSHILGGAKRAGVDLTVFAHDDLFPHPAATPSRRDAAVRALEAHLAAHRPALVIIDANFLPDAARTVTPQIMAALRRTHGFCLVAGVWDAYEESFSPPALWEGRADGVIGLSPDGLYVDPWAERGRYLPLPGLPFDPDGPLAAPPAAEKDLDFVFVGANNRFRAALLDPVRQAPLRQRIVLHDRRQTTAIGAGDYAELLRRGRCTFNNGWARYDTIITGRVSEAMAAGCLVLEAVNTNLEAFFTPFIHYIPVANASQLMAYLRYFHRHEDDRRRVSDAAGAFLRDHYGPAAFWRRLAEMVGLGAGRTGAGR